MNKKISAFLLATIVIASVPLAQAQQPKIPRVGVITAGGAWYEVINGLRVGLKQLGFEEGKQFTLAIRATKGAAKAAEEGVSSLEHEKVNLIYTTQTSVTLATKKATKETPVVFSVLGQIRSNLDWWRVLQTRRTTYGCFLPGHGSNC